MIKNVAWNMEAKLFATFEIHSVTSIHMIAFTSRNRLPNQSLPHQLVLLRFQCSFRVCLMALTANLNFLVYKSSAIQTQKGAVMNCSQIMQMLLFNVATVARNGVSSNFRFLR
ncbi:hypothetical protein ASPBRDRAFT_619397 [Aspergillus brasiliensis CBS 101740]|uniref:Uncharacterized protein n=1 Tax=Aspergillus brasiliensis (strain CBS 101740 / IMI 381727 / IBT 21946) TaxID=767769 RepID=A0A1L9UFF6_ASPBC|nr:hypothetical protein ASPBRDRAFT_619397 [Aspergillus brasiliensis CBS 101740]